MPGLKAAVGRLSPWLLDLRRRLHACPELKYQERRTAAAAEEVLSQAGLPALTGLGGTGLAALWDSGRPGPTVAFRADMDGLGLTEPPGSPFISTNPGVMHACGHDFNLALVLALARLAAEGALTPPGGRLMFICQPAEEHGAGALAMLNDGLFEAAGKPDLIFAGHAEPLRRPGHFIINPGAVMAGVLDFEITVTGRGGHAATPERAESPLPHLARLILELSAFKPPPGAILTLTTARGGEWPNIIDPGASTGGTVRWHTPQARDRVRAFIEERVRNVSAGRAVKAGLAWREGYPPVVNDPDLAALARAVAEKMAGPAMVQAERPSFGGEDFAYFLQRTPGVFIFFGTGGPGFDAPLHSAEFKINESALAPALEFWARLALAALSRG